MIRKLRIKLIAVSMLSLFAVLAVIMVTVNLVNFIGILQEADGTLSLLEQNDGKFPIRNDKPMGQKVPGETHDFSPELPFESRFFSVLISTEGEILSADTASIAAVDSENAARMAREILDTGKNKGFSGNYRYAVYERSGGTRIIFLDCTRGLSTFTRFLTVSGIISLVGLLAVFLLIFILSGRIVRPVSESYEKQKRFITDAGHEIKTPITVIDADAEVLEMDMGGNEWLTDIRRQVRRLGGLTNDLIYLSRMEEEHPRLSRIDFPLSDVVAETAQSFQAPARMRSKCFSMEIEPMLTLHGDEKAIRELVSVLLDNAVKYADGEGEIHLSLKRQGKNAVLRVSNPATGLAGQKPERFFERFYRADPSRDSSTGGYGIGLSIARAVVLAHRGKIGAETEGNILIVTAVVPLT